MLEFPPIENFHRKVTKNTMKKGISRKDLS